MYIEGGGGCFSEDIGFDSIKTTNRSSGTVTMLRPGKKTPKNANPGLFSDCIRTQQNYQG